jgi:hypothetical protein
MYTLRINGVTFEVLYFITPGSYAIRSEVALPADVVVTVDGEPGRGRLTLHETVFTEYGERFIYILDCL